MSTDPFSRQALAAVQPTWADTDIKTQVWGGGPPKPDLVSTPSDIGEAVGQHTRELFVSCDATQAIRMQLDLTGLRYMVIGDLGGGLARRCLMDTARASGWPVQKLLVRRQGFGDTLATVLFLDSPTQDGRHVRVFCADVDADDANRASLFHLLLARAELVALLVPDQAAALQAQAIEALRDEVSRTRTPWLNRQLIFMPTKTSPDLIGHITGFREGTGIQARMAPAVKRADQVWVYLGSTWNQMQEAALPDQALRLKTLALVAPAPPKVEPVARPLSTSVMGDLSPLPEPSVAEAEPVARRCVQHLMRQMGVHRVCVFDLRTLAIEGHTGTLDEAQAMARQGRTLLSAMGRAGEEMALGHAISEAQFTLLQHRVVLRGLAAMPGCVMHVIMDRSAPPLGPMPTKAQLLDSP